MKAEHSNDTPPSSSLKTHCVIEQKKRKRLPVSYQLLDLLVHYTSSRRNVGLPILRRDLSYLYSLPLDGFHKAVSSRFTDVLTLYPDLINNINIHQNAYFIKKQIQFLV